MSLLFRWASLLRAAARRVAQQVPGPDSSDALRDRNALWRVVTETALGLLAFNRPNLPEADRRLAGAEAALKELPEAPFVPLLRGAIQLHRAGVARDYGEVAEARARLSIAKQAFLETPTADPLLRYAVEHGRWLAAGWERTDAERRGDPLRRDHAAREAEALRPSVPLREALTRTLAEVRDEASVPEVYVALLLLQDRCRDILVGMIELADVMARSTAQEGRSEADRAGGAYAAAQRLLAAMPDAAAHAPAGKQPTGAERRTAIEEARLEAVHAVLLERQGDYQEALAALLRAERLATASPAEPAGRQFRTLLLTERGRLEISLGKVEAAEQALREAEELAPNRDADRRGLAHAVAGLCQQRGELARAFVALERAATLPGTLLDRADTLVRLAGVAILLGRHAAASTHLDAAEQLLDDPAERTGHRDRAARHRVLSASTLFQRAEILRARSLRPENASEAASFRSQAQGVYRLAGQIAHGLAGAEAWGIALASRLGLGTIAALDGEFEQAAEIYGRVEQAAGEGPGLSAASVEATVVARRVRSAAQVNRAALLCRQQCYDQAMPLLRELLATPERLVDRSELALLHFLRAGAAEALASSDDLASRDMVISEYERAMEVYESIALDVRPELLGAFQEVHTGLLYARLAAALVRAGRDWDALAVAEHGRAQGLERRRAINAAGDGASRAEEIGATGTAPRITGEDLRGLTESRPDTLFLVWQMLSWGADHDRALVFSICAGRLKVWTEEYGVSLHDTVSRFRRFLFTAARAEGASESSDEERTLAREIFERLLGRVDGNWGVPHPGREACQAGPRRMCLVVDGPLHLLPWAALRDRQDRYLIEGCALSFAPSLRAFRRSAGPLTAADSLLRVIYDPREGTAEAIPQIWRESDWLAQHFPTSRALLRGEARPERVLQMLASQPWKAIHFAVHGRCDRSDGLRSALVLAGCEPGRVGYLYAWQICAQPLRADLVVLSACDTGLGERSGGEGLLGLTWSFAAAGCVAVVATLWPVRDDAMPELMASFYSRLQGGLPPDEALRQAALALLRGDAAADDRRPAGALAVSGWRHPYFWAGVQCWGGPPAEA